MAKIQSCVSFVLVFYACIVLPSFARRFEAPKHLNGLNKHPVKSIKSSDGDIIDCIHILHQPAFDNPLLKNHTIKMSPSYHPNGITSIKNGSSSPPFAQIWHSNGKCPKGTIPIRRTRKDDTIFAQIHKKKSPFDSQLDDIRNHEWAHASMDKKGKYYGTQATFNVWNPRVQIATDLSLGQLWITAVSETIEAGWQVLPSLYGDSSTRFFIFWTNDGYRNVHCYNLECQGFIQTNNKIVIGGSISPTSEFDGSQCDITILIWKDPKDGNWWLEVNGTILGYWPSSLYHQLSQYAFMLDWGGEVINSKVDGLHTTTQMGSGHFSGEGLGKASYIKNIQIMNESNVLTSPEHLSPRASRKDCYDVTMGDNDVDNWGTYFFFGGPGRNENCAAMADARRSTIFFTEQHLSYADIIPPFEVRARIEVAVLNFLKVLNSPNPEISSLPMHAIFQRLVEDRVFNQIPSILITAKGYPDIATRFLLHRMSREFPEIKILGLVDWNPAGLAILCTFKYGSIGMGLEAYRYGYSSILFFLLDIEQDISS
ncbi:hypothetical protein SSX86_009332 [Deinandra increscens subsp. villosa]|uniref:Neprosin PEP catalytic domain-containing protein n=1 Tax=Deinandra increscens subsp. villosa TaxID=3103831 RepID=A0AAP0H5X1_9ASTR